MLSFLSLFVSTVYDLPCQYHHVIIIVNNNNNYNNKNNNNNNNNNNNDDDNLGLSTRWMQSISTLVY